MGVIVCSTAGDVWAAGCALFLAVTGRTSIFEARTPVGRLHEMRRLYGAAEIEEYAELLGAPLCPIAHAYDRARVLDAQHSSPPPPPPLSFVTCRHRDHQPRVCALSGGRTQSRLQRAPIAPTDEPLAKLVLEVRAVSRSSARRTQASLISVATGGSACLQLTPRRARRVRGRALLGPHPAGRHAGAQRRGTLFGCRGFGLFTAPQERPLTLSLSHGYL